MSGEQKHSPLPFHFDGQNVIHIPPAGILHYVPVAALDNRETFWADGEFIARACNNYYRMIDAMEAARKEIMWWADQDGEPHESEAIRLIDAVLPSPKEHREWSVDE